jgi:signal transduction histidine kinase
MHHRETHMLTGFVLVLAVIIGGAVFATLAYEHRRTRDDFIALATSESQVVLNTLMIAIQGVGNIRLHLHQAGVATNVIQDVMSRFGTGRLLQKVGLHSMFDYIACQDAAGIVAATGVDRLSTIAADPFLQRAISNHLFATRLLPGKPVRLEAVQPFVTDTKQYLLRVCMSLSAVQELEQRKTRRQILLGGIVLCVTLLAVTYAINLHSSRLLARERDAITAEVERIQQRLGQQERVTAIGRLAAGVAHEIRNPLNAVQILVQRFDREIQPMPESQAKYAEFTRVIKDELKRVNQIIEEFLRFARVRPPAFERVDVAALVRDICALEHGELAERTITLDQHIAAHLEPIEADPQQIKQALVNIIKNAIDATPADGRITVGIAQRDGATTITVRDTGRGMDELTRERAFDLYFTTKDCGLGIGLAITRRIIDDHHGEITLGVNKPQGAVVTVRLPNRQPHENPHH